MFNVSSLIFNLVFDLLEQSVLDYQFHHQGVNWQRDGILVDLFADDVKMCLLHLILRSILLIKKKIIEHPKHQPQLPLRFVELENLLQFHLILLRQPLKQELTDHVHTAICNILMISL